MDHQELHARWITGEIAGHGVRIPIQAGGRWAVERTNSWMGSRPFFAAGSVTSVPRAFGEILGAVPSLLLHGHLLTS
jgi:hypothetical protein